jgi:hypothetical protein
MALYKNPDFLQLPPSVSSIFTTAGVESFFALPRWYDLMARFGVPAGTEIRVYADERPGSTAAILLQVAHQEGCPSLTSLANAYSVEHGLLHPTHGGVGVSVEEILGEIGAERPRWACLRLLEFDPVDPSYAALLHSLRRRGFLVECTPGSGTWFEKTDQMTFGDYLAERPSKLRSTWSRKRRSIGAAGRLSRAFFASPSGLDQAIADYQTVYSASWKPPEAFPRFIRELIRLAAELGALRMGIYYMDGAPAAAQFWIVWKGRAVIYKLAHDRKFDKLSVGTLLTMDMIERVLADDRPYEINLGRGDDAYKRMWLPKRRQRWGITAANPRTLSGLRLGLEREAAKLYHRMLREPITPQLPDRGS